ncbi:hypothetical protein B566_EDAN005399 [Ephemera danica]|nr:hypothetical protein B566_EDAN005399 [Ephemera danica]
MIINGLAIVPFLFLPFVVFELPGALAKISAFLATITITGNIVYDWRIIFICYQSINDVEHEHLENSHEI